MTDAHAIRALIFDMDGTLVDTETQTDVAIAIVLARLGVPDFALPPADTRGRTWPDVARRIRELTGVALSVEALSAALLEEWNLATAQVKPVAGAPEALARAARAGLRLSVVSSSPVAVIERLLGAIGVLDLVGRGACVGGDQVARGKPDPEGFLRAAKRLGATPAQSIVFEDSRAGLLAAGAAGMRAVFITCCATDVAANRPLAAAEIHDYRELPDAFFADPARGLEQLRGGSGR
ncbi:MAG: HAD family phosphatase [Proteobacteria bacterium]|nr:HAD family phosphatase [Pseudomonadota bacterium]